MVASLQGVKKGSLVHRFITSGKKGYCELCHSLVEKLEAHHIQYSPEITIKLCHLCHHKVHFWPNRLSDDEKLKLLELRFDKKIAREIIEKKALGIQALAKLIAPSKSAFIHAEQLKEKRLLKNAPSPVIRKVNKPVNPSILNHMHERKVK